jgi:hypothetical protein
MHNAKKETKKSGDNQVIALIWYALIILILLLPMEAYAHPGKEASCTACHTLVDPDASISVFIDNVATTSIEVPNDGTASFEIDYFFSNITDTANYEGVGVHISVPSGWGMAAGNNVFSPPGWNTVWDFADGVGWSPVFDTGAEFPDEPDGYTVNFETSPWDTGNRDSACDNGGSCSSGTDQDGTIDTMGSDAIVSIPLGTPGGSYTVRVLGIGHHNDVKAHGEDLITVTVTADVTSAVSEISPNSVVVNSLGNVFTYDILPTITGLATGVDRVDITAPSGYSNFNVTGASVGGTGLIANCPVPGAGQYCASIAAPVMTVTLGTKVTTSLTNIQITFTADAPTFTGDDAFISTVDDTGTARPPVTVSVGNADGNPGDNNSQTVTVVGNTLNWVGGNNNDFNNSLNWSPNRVPSQSDECIINSYSTYQPVIQSNAFCGSIKLGTAGPPVISLTFSAGNNLDVSGDIVIGPDGRIAASGTPTGAFSIGGNWSDDLGTTNFTSSNLHLDYHFDGTAEPIFTDESFYDVQINGDITMNTDLTVANSFLISNSGTFSQGTNTIFMNGPSFTNNGTYNFDCNSVLEINSTLSLQGGGRYPIVIVNSGANVSGANPAYIDCDLTLQSGSTFDPGQHLHVKGDWINNGATINLGNSMVHMNGLNAQIRGTTQTDFYDLVIGEVPGTVITPVYDIAIGHDLTVSKGATLNISSGNDISVVNNTTISGDLNLSGTTTWNQGGGNNTGITVNFGGLLSAQGTDSSNRVTFTRSDTNYYQMIVNGGIDFQYVNLFYTQDANAGSGIAIKSDSGEIVNFDYVAINNTEDVNGATMMRWDSNRTLNTTGVTFNSSTYSTVDGDVNVEAVQGTINLSGYGGNYAGEDKDNDNGGNAVWNNSITTIGDGTAPSNQTISVNSSNKAVSAFTLSTDSGTDTLTALTITRSGTSTDSDVASNGVKLWRDDGLTSNEWDAADTQIGSGVTLSSGTASFSSLSESINATPTQYIVTYDIVSGAISGRTLQGAVTAATVSNTLVNNDTTDATLTIAGLTCNVDPNGTYIEAEDFSGTSAGDGTYTFAGILSAQADYLGTGYLETDNKVNMEDFSHVNLNPDMYDRYDYSVNFPTTGTYQIWMRGYEDGSDADDSNFIGLNETAVGAIKEDVPGAGWEWTSTVQNGVTTITIGTAGIHTINVWPREQTHKLDALYITTGASVPTDGVHGIEIDPSGCSTTTLGDGVSPVSRDVWAGGKFFGVDAFTLQTDSGTADLTALTVTFSGTNVSDIAASGVKLWKDDGGSDDKWDSTDTFISTAAAFVGNNATFSGFSEPINTTSTQYIITYNIDSAAGVGNTLQGTVTAATVSNFLVNNDTVDATLTVEADVDYETSIYKVSYSPGTIEDLFLKGTSAPATDVLTSFTMGNDYADLGAMIMTWDPDMAVTTQLSNSVVTRLQMSGLMIDANGNSFGPTTANINFYEDRIVFDLTVNISPNPTGTDYLFMTYGVWDDATLDEIFWWSSNNSGSYNSADPAPNFNTGNQTTPISFQALFEMGATDGLINATLTNISNYVTAELKNTDPDTGKVDIAFQNVNPVIGSNIQTSVMYSFDTTTSGYDTTITEERQDGFISPATMNFGIADGDGSVVGDGYEELRGAYTLNDGDADDHVRFQFEPTTTHHAPVFEITGWNSGAPAYIDVGGVLKTSGTHYNAAVTGTTLYLQYLSNISANTIIEIPSSCPGFVVTTTSDSGMGSLRACIDLANTNPGADTITFNITGCPGGLCTINPSTALPDLNDATGGTTIDGYSQTGASANTVAAPGVSDAVLNIEIDESGAAAFTGLTITSADNVIKGLIMGGFNNGSPAIEITGSSATDNIISGNYLGTNSSGTAANPNRHGVSIENGAQNNTIGGTDPADRNIISGNSEYGVQIDGTDTNLNVVVGNYIGTDINGTGDLGNTLLGIAISGGAQSNTIGGNTGAERNIISGNNGGGIRIYNGSTNLNVVKGNFIGTDVNGTATLENSSRGILIDSGAQSNTIGGTAAGAGNVISGNTASGIYITGVGSDGNIIQGNIIGTDFGGTLNLGNTTGIYVVSGPLNTIIGGISNGGNTVAFNTSRGIRTHGGGSAQVLGNIIYSNSRSGISSTASGISFIKNVIRDNGTAGPTDDDGIYLNASADNNLIYHNTIHASNGDGILLNDAGLSGTIIKNNIITANGGWGINNTIAATITNDYNNVPASPTAQGNTSGSCTGCSLGSSSLALDPLYNDEPGDDYTLTECTSPAINTGCDLGVAGDDTFCDTAADGAQPDMNGATTGNFNNNAPDMGAYETGNCAPGLTIVKQVWEEGGSAPLGNPTAPVGATLVFLIYVKNTTAGLVSDLRINDDLDESGFEYVADTLRRTSNTVPPSDTDTDLTIFNKTGDGTSIALSDAVDVAPATEVASAQDTGGPVTVDKITIGAVAAQTNASLNVGPHETFALRFKVKVK